MAFRDVVPTEPSGNLGEVAAMSGRGWIVWSVALIAGWVSAADWPEFRGPKRDGVCTETGLLKSWPASGPPLLWKVGNRGAGWGAPSIAEGKIFGIGLRDGKDGIWALNEADGKELWFTPFADPPATGSAYKNQTNGPASTPTIANGKAYVVSGDGTLACVQTSDGKLLWTKNYVRDYGGQVPTWAYTESVLVDGRKVIGTPGGSKAVMVAWEADTGKEIWRCTGVKAGGAGGYSSPVKAVIANVPMYVVLTGTSGGLIGVHADTGKLLWQYRGRAATGGVAQIPMPIISGDKVWVSCSYDGGAALLQLLPKGDGTFTVKELKTYPVSELNNHHGGMVLVDGYLYFGHGRNQGHPVCVEFATGEIKWGPEQNARAVGGGQGSAAVLYADGRLYFRYQNGVMVLIEPSPEALKVVSTFRLPPPDNPRYSQSWPHPVIANGRLYIRDQNMLYCYNVKL
jgi:outer membrane protein assembly factor BamB